MTSKFLFLNTKYSDNPNTPNDTSWNIPTKFSESSLHKIQLHSMTLPNLVYTTKLQTITFQENNTATDLTFTFPAGTYQPSELTTALKTGLDGAGANSYTVAYDSVTDKITITCTGTNFKLVGSSDTSTLYNVLEQCQFQTGSFVTTLTSLYPIKIDGTSTVEVMCSKINSNYSSDNSKSNTLFVCPVGNYAETTTYQTSTDSPLELTSNIGSIDLRLLDEEGNDFELPPNAIVTYILKFSI